MALIVIDGPRAVGKSRLVEALSAALPVHYVWSWDVIANAMNTRKFEAILRDTINAINNNQSVIVEKSWTRSTLAEQLKKPTDFAPRSAEFLAEWRFGRLVQYCGLRVMLLAPSDLLADRRKDEKALNVRYERAIYANYAKRWDWLTVEHRYDAETFNRATCYVYQHVPAKFAALEEYPGYCGPRYASTVFVSSADRDELDVCAGKFLPFTSEALTNIGAYYQNCAAMFGWAHARRIPPVALRSAKLLIALDDEAETWCWHHVGAKNVRRLSNPRKLSALIKRGESVRDLETIAAETIAYRQGDR